MTESSFSAEDHQTTEAPQEVAPKPKYKKTPKKKFAPGELSGKTPETLKKIKLVGGQMLTGEPVPPPRPEEVRGQKIDWSNRHGFTKRHIHTPELRAKYFGKLLVYAYAGKGVSTTGKPSSLWKARCDCGKHITISAWDLKQGRKKHCGCGPTPPVPLKHLFQSTQAPQNPSVDPALVFARESLIAYACLQWAGYEPAAHHQLIAKYLEKVERGEVNRLMICMPPRHGKSSIVSEYFPAWFLGKNPDKMIVTASYGQELASDFGRKVRNQIADPLFPKLFNGVTIAEDSAAIDKFNMSSPNKGGYFAVGVGGALTGRGANCVSGDTMVATDRGLFRIDYLFSRYPKFNVLSYSLEHDALEFKPIVAVKKSIAKSKIVITKTCDGKSIWSTPDHLFYIPDEKNYRPAILLASGDELLTNMATIDTVINTMTVDIDSMDVYDIQVQDNHNFFANGILIHNCLIIDDPIKSREDADSESNRRKIKDWYTAVAYTRLMGNGAIVICQTRWHLSDLSGWLLEEHKHENWVVLNLPAINSKGEALWPERYPLETLYQIKKTLPSRDWEALYQQKPFIEEGGIFKREWWKMWPENKKFPTCSFVIQAWDTATTDKDLKSNSYSARTTWGIFQGPDDEVPNVILLEAWKERVEFPELQKEALRAYREYEPDKVLIEKKSSGQQLIQILRRMGLPLVEFLPEKIGDKTARAYAAQNLFENGRVYYPSRRWAEDVIDELARFSPSSPNDLTDSSTSALIWLQKSWLLQHSDMKEEDDPTEDEEEDDLLPSNVRRFKPRKRSAYG